MGQTHFRSHFVDKQLLAKVTVRVRSKLRVKVRAAGSPAVKSVGPVAGLNPQADQVKNLLMCP